MYKSENKHTWEHFSTVIIELRSLLYGNRNHINAHIKATDKAVQELQKVQEQHKKESVEFEINVRNKVKGMVEDMVLEELKKHRLLGDNESDLGDDQEGDEDDENKVQKT